MAITQKFNLPSTLGDEAKRYRELFEKGNNRTAAGSVSFTSATSGTTYNSTSGEAGIFAQLQSALEDYNIDADFIGTLIEFDSENNLLQYDRDVITIDSNGNPTVINYNRSGGGTLFLKRTYSNPDSNGYYQTVVEQYYQSNGTTVYKTIAYTLTYFSNGIIDTSGRVVS